MKIKIIFLFSLIFVLLFIVAPVKANTFDPNNIISDFEILDWTSMNLDDIKKFLRDKESCLANYQTNDCSEDDLLQKKQCSGKLISAAEIIYSKADSGKDHMGLTTWKNAPHGKIIKPDVSVAKNYLTEKELKSLDRFVTMYLDYAEDQAERNIPMTMEDWAKKLNAFLQFNERDILDNPGKVSREVAKAFAESEFEHYRIVQDRLFESDFDRHVKKLLE